jgi:dGTPase
MDAENAELRHFLFHNFYRHYRVVRMATKAARTLTSLFGAYVEQPQQLPPETQAKASSGEGSLQRVVCDYVAGMTDRYAIQEYRRLFDMEERA